MSDEKSKVTDKASEIAKNIWLAGVGAYGKAVEDAQGRLEKAMEPPKLFRELVKAGSALEDEAKEAIEAVEASSAATRNSVEERIARVRENFHNQRPARIEDLLALHKKVDQLTRKVDSLTRALEKEGIVAKSRARKTPAKAKTKTRAKAKTKAKAGTKTAAKATRKAPARKKAVTRSRS